MWNLHIRFFPNNNIENYFHRNSVQLSNIDRNFSALEMARIIQPVIVSQSERGRTIAGLRSKLSNTRQYTTSL